MTSTATFTSAESGGPPPVEPSRTGYGTQFIQGAVTRELGGKVEMMFQPTGLICMIDIPLGAAAF